MNDLKFIKWCRPQGRRGFCYNIAMNKKIFIVAIVLITTLLGFWIYTNRDWEIKNLDQGKNIYQMQIVAFGDSLVYGTGSSKGGGFVSILSEDLGIEIINLGRPGDTTVSAKERLQYLLSLKPDIVLVALGGNDFLRRLGPASEVEKRLGEIVKEIQSSGAAVILLEEPGYKSIYKKLAKKYKTAYVPNILEGLFGNPEFMSDRIHPNDKGYKIIANKIKRALMDMVN